MTVGPRLVAVLTVPLLLGACASGAGPRPRSSSTSYGRYLLFTDGSILDHLPSGAPADFDAAASRAAEPASWGTRAVDGDQLIDTGSDLSQLVTGSSESGRGRYRFDGSLLELTFDDGHTERVGAYFTSDDRATLLLNGVSFGRDL